MTRQKLLIASVIAVAAIVGWLFLGQMADRAALTELHDVATDLSGKFDSTTPPVPFSGSEAVITFSDIEFANGDIPRLANALHKCRRHFVVIHFQNTNATDADADDLRNAISNCRVIFDNYRIDDANTRTKNAE